jgi:uncharacterized membrane protein (DUF373 family)
MDNIKQFFKNKFYIEMIIATILFIYAIITNNMINIIINLLYFIIFLEIIRLISDYINEKRIRIRIIIDTFIILTLRELIVNVVKINKEEFQGINDIFSSSVNSHIMIFSGVLLFLFILRYLAIITSPETIKQ